MRVLSTQDTALRSPSVSAPHRESLKPREAYSTGPGLLTNLIVPKVYFASGTSHFFQVGPITVFATLKYVAESQNPPSPLVRTLYREQISNHTVCVFKLKSWQLCVERRHGHVREKLLSLSPESVVDASGHSSPVPRWRGAWGGSLVLGCWSAGRCAYMPVARPSPSPRACMRPA